MEFNSTYWHERAREMRNVADQTKEPQSNGTMLAIAHDYDLLARQFEYREKWAPLRDNEPARSEERYALAMESINEGAHDWDTLRQASIHSAWNS
jgi:hypothetical protein